MALKVGVFGKTRPRWKWFSLCKWSETKIPLIFINYMSVAMARTRMKSIA